MSEEDTRDRSAECLRRTHTVAGMGRRRSRSGPTLGVLIALVIAGAAALGFFHTPSGPLVTLPTTGVLSPAPTAPAGPDPAVSAAAPASPAADLLATIPIKGRA